MICVTEYGEGEGWPSEWTEGIIAFIVKKGEGTMAE